ncbi:MAG: YhbY family RNA-binding protein [Coxiellaceae bacterium]|nr:MAG: YhbY family RNA-binding protein [Coxiellaceae bacterium]
MRKRAPSLKPVVLIGQHGLTDNVQQEIANALLHHELIKIRINTRDREYLKQVTAAICEFHQAELIQHIGHTIVIYKANPDK